MLEPLVDNWPWILLVGGLIAIVWSLVHHAAARERRRGVESAAPGERHHLGDHGCAGRHGGGALL